MTDISRERAAPGAITIARHGEPDLDRRVKLDWRGYEAWWARYDEAGLKPGQEAPSSLREQAEAAQARFSSTLPRAIETAAAACGELSFVSESIFVEAPLPPPTIPGRFSPRTWGGLARCSWWMGWSRGRESRAEAEQRAERAAAFLTDAARAGNVVLFAHGWFNRMLRPALKAQGYACRKDGGDHYWSWRRYEPRG
jgi:broad specificity phosphatase PhoE